MYNIIEYNNQYEKQVKDLIVSIFVNEFGYKQCRNEILSENLTNYFNNGGKLWIAVNKENNVIGTCAAKVINEEIMELKRMYVLKEYRGIGVSKELYNIFENYAKSQGSTFLKLSTRNNLERAISFYKKCGFIQESESISNNGVVNLYKKI